MLLYANPDNCSAGVHLSCISRVSPVSTIGAWTVRNLPPQTIIWVKPIYSMNIITILFPLVKNVFIAE